VETGSIGADLAARLPGSIVDEAQVRALWARYGL